MSLTRVFTIVLVVLALVVGTFLLLALWSADDREAVGSAGARQVAGVAELRPSPAPCLPVGRRPR